MMILRGDIVESSILYVQNKSEERVDQLLLTGATSMRMPNRKHRPTSEVQPRAPSVPRLLPRARAKNSIYKTANRER